MLPTARFGFSLLEVLMAVMILALGIISIAALFPAGIAQQRMSNDDYMGPIVASHAMNVIRNKVKAEEFGSFEDYRPAFAAVGADPPSPLFTRTIYGDWGWMRPGYIFEDNDDTEWIDERGAIDIFSHQYVGRDILGDTDWPDIDSATEFPGGWLEESLWNSISGGGVNQPLYGIPARRSSWRYIEDDVVVPPRRIITQRERYYPMPAKPHSAGEIPPQPQYVWDCMFRRYGGEIQVAIFVYRVSSPTAGSRPYTVQPNTGYQFPGTADLPHEWQSPMPFKLDLRDGSAGIADWYGIGLNSPYGRNTRGAWDVPYQDIGGVLRPQPFVPGAIIDEFNLDDPRQSWQQSRQWLLDQNNNIHRVLSRSRDQDSEVMRVELTEPLAPVRVSLSHIGQQEVDIWWWNTVDTNFPPYVSPYNTLRLSSGVPDSYFAIPDGDVAPEDFPHIDVGVVTEIFYIPRTVIDDLGNEWTLTPVYVAVKEL